MSSPAPLAERLRARSIPVGVVGLGYVGLPLAALLAEAGFSVIGVDRDAARVARINAGENPIEGREPDLGELVAAAVAGGRLTATPDPGRLAAAGAVFVCVETPVDEAHRPNYSSLEAACRGVGAVLGGGALVVVESTLAPGTMNRLVIPALQASSGGRAGRDFLVGHCPERVMPGRLVRNMRTMSRVIGAASEEAAEAMTAIYSAFVTGELDVSDPLTAELVKTSENAYRDVNIAFANQVALICEQVGGDVFRVRELVNKSPGRLMLVPGAGVGGHCIPKDSWLLASSAGDGEAPVLRAARELNDLMPAHVARLVADALGEAGVPTEGARVAVLGYSYLEDSGDTRNSPTAALLAELEAMGCLAAVHDPFVPGYQGEPASVLEGAVCAVLMVAHSEYRALDPAWLASIMRHAVLVEGRAVFDARALESAGFVHRRVGVGGRVGVAGVL